MNSVPDKHTKKKRRLDENEPSTSGCSAHMLPLVRPNLVRRSSRDPNKNLYPQTRKKSFKPMPCPQFQKAAELLKQSSTKDETYNTLSQEPGTSNSHDIAQSASRRCYYAKVKFNYKNPVKKEKKFNIEDKKLVKPPNLASDSSINCESDNPKDSEKKVKFQRKKNKYLPPHQANKITKYFKTSLNITKKKTIVLKKANEVVKANQNTKDSAWLQKDEDYLPITEDNEKFFKNYNTCYGLVEDQVAGNSENYFDKLPNHVIENILCQIPILDLLACRLVCCRWKDIIDNDKFMEWKKLYFKYKKGEDDVAFYVYDLIKEAGHSTIEDGLETLVNFMGSKFNRRPSKDMHSLLMKNRIGEVAYQVLLERFPRWEGKDSRVWCQFAIALIISETSQEIYDLYLSLFTEKSACSRHDVINAMYCILLFLLYYRNSCGINYGLHYRIYCALYIIENQIPNSQKEKLKIIKGLQGQQSIHSYSEGGCSYLTYEQIRILNHRFEPKQKIRIIALAGTGKTTTLLHLARLYPQINFLNLVFNRSVSEDAKKRFPSNVTCQTAHSLAFAVTGKSLKHKLAAKIRPFELLGSLKHNEGKIQIYTYARFVLTTIENFVTSTSTEMSLVHVPYLDFKRSAISDANRDRILMDAFTIWMKMIDKDNSMKITHDVYLKLYQLKRPLLEKYQCIMVDEAQDCNPVMIDIVLSQNVPVIFVGDPNQQIYRFRGAQNALYSINATHTYHLTKSFRFGPEIAYVASCILELLLTNTKTTIVGNSCDSYIDGKTQGQYCIISRSNIKLFNEAVRLIVFKDLKPYEPSVINGAFAGGISSYGFEQILDICRLREGGNKDKGIKDKFISRFASYYDLCSYAKYAEDVDLLAKIEIINQHGAKIFNYVSLIKEKCSHPIELANVVFSTAHKAKGLEFDTVNLTDDFSFCSSFQIGNNDDLREEINILYVALTRAKKCLLLPEKIRKIMHMVHEKFEYPVPSSSYTTDKGPLKCVHCEDTFTPHTVLILKRRKFILATGREITGGPVCMKCGSDPMMRPDVHINGIVMYLDCTNDNSHRFLNSITGPLPNDPPIVHDRFIQFENADRVFVINLNLQ